MKVGDILRKKTARVATVRMNETVAIAAQLLRASDISALVVKDVVRTEGNTAVGMFTRARRGARDRRAWPGRLCPEGVATDLGAATRVLQPERHTRTSTPHDEPASHPAHAGDRQYSLIGVVSIRDISTAFDEEAKASNTASTQSASAA